MPATEDPRLPRLRARVSAWQRAATIREFCAAAGMDKRTASNWAAMMRRDFGVPLKTMRPEKTGKSGQPLPQPARDELIRLARAEMGEKPTDLPAVLHAAANSEAYRRFESGRKYDLTFGLALGFWSAAEETVAGQLELFDRLLRDLDRPELRPLAACHGMLNDKYDRQIKLCAARNGTDGKRH